MQVRWEFGDAMLNLATDCYSDITKLESVGYGGMHIRSGDDFVACLTELAELKILPNYPKHARTARKKAEKHSSGASSPHKKSASHPGPSSPKAKRHAMSPKAHQAGIAAAG